MVKQEDSSKSIHIGIYNTVQLNTVICGLIHANMIIYPVKQLSFSTFQQLS